MESLDLLNESVMIQSKLTFKNNRIKLSLLVVSKLK